MTKRQYSKTASRKRNCQLGFTFVEVLMAIVILLVGIVAVAQLVPASISSNSTNRNDSSALVFAQREMDQFLRQPLNMSLIPPAFFSHFVMVPSKIDSPICGITTLVGMDPSCFRFVFRLFLVANHSVRRLLPMRAQSWVRWPTALERWCGMEFLFF
ncbi:MAG: prepilin-type N-terminal cleavage/methylation domain-containing protein, partial [Candidatus Acidiferrum sp.]